jgi:phospholipase/lecithinase/hemolysin
MYRKIYPEALLNARPSFYLTFPDECHPNPTGHRLLAARLSAIIDDPARAQR